ncbi:thioredoxin domain-containing protein [Clostridioides mangenotii]|uniref:thioredoxin TrxA n=1 Tax=Metaclostridioides mangenotii TaxID=1540 RepID=UPI001C11E89A|nr:MULTISPECIES: thioredoxin domain-containing protein [Clostridioides]MBS5788448.1 thioredoxin [Clostridioides difficile]MBU5307756.1 thioredoxin [Clostridioides mangenotii]MCR1954779.1 thioredoxin domain-containing protein [Clostridioides mangenotii]
MLSLDKETFEAEVLNSDEVVFVDFWSEGCEPCKALLPDIEKLSETYGDKIKFCKMDTTKARRLAIKQKVLGLPTLAIYKNGEKIDEVTKDDATVPNIEEMIKKHL